MVKLRKIAVLLFNQKIINGSIKRIKMKKNTSIRRGNFVFLFLIIAFIMLGCDKGSDSESNSPATTTKPATNKYAGYWESKSILTGLTTAKVLWLGITVNSDGTVSGKGGIYIKGFCAFESGGICFSYSWSPSKNLSVSGNLNQMKIGSETYTVTINPVNDNEIELAFSGDLKSNIYR